MARPQVTVNISGALPVASASADTGRLFFLYAGTGGPAVPTVVGSVAAATDADVPDAVAAWIGDALAEGVSEVVVLHVAAADTAAVTQTEWAAALVKLTPSYGAGQVAIPGVSTSAAHQALLAHVAANAQRIALLDLAADATASAGASAAAAIAAAPGANRAAVVAPWAVFPATGGGTRTTPASVLAAGLAGRGDAAVGHANQAPIFDQGRDAGAVSGATGVTTVYTDAETDTLYDAGVNVFRLLGGTVTLTGWRSVSTDAVWRQLNVGRLAMAISATMTTLMVQYLGRPIDGQGHLFSEIEGVITAELQEIWEAQGLYGATAAEAFTVVCDFSNNTPQSIAAGQVKASVAITASTAAEQIVINVVTSLAN